MLSNDSVTFRQSEDLRTEPVAHFIPWSQMTPRQQAEHLVYAHGFDSDYLGMTGDPDAVQHFLSRTARARADWHTPEHGDDYLHGGRDNCQHDHDKEPGPSQKEKS